MKFRIVIKHDRKDIRLNIERIEATTTSELFKVSARNQSFVLQNNRPLIRGKGLKHFPITWKVVQGGYHHPHILGLITAEIEKKL